MVLKCSERHNCMHSARVIRCRVVDLTPGGSAVSPGHAAATRASGSVVRREWEVPTGQFRAESKERPGLVSGWCLLAVLYANGTRTRPPGGRHSGRPTEALRERRLAPATVKARPELGFLVEPAPPTGIATAFRVGLGPGRPAGFGAPGIFAGRSHFCGGRSITMGGCEAPQRDVERGPVCTPGGLSGRWNGPFRFFRPLSIRWLVRTASVHPHWRPGDVMVVSTGEHHRWSRRGRWRGNCRDVELAQHG